MQNNVLGAVLHKFKKFLFNYLEIKYFSSGIDMNENKITIFSNE